MLDRAVANCAGVYRACVWSLWPLEGLPPDPLDLWQIPIMVRDAGGDAPVAPSDLEIVEATDASTVRKRPRSSTSRSNRNPSRTTY